MAKQAPKHAVEVNEHNLNIAFALADKFHTNSFKSHNNEVYLLTSVTGRGRNQLRTYTKAAI